MWVDMGRLVRNETAEESLLSIFSVYELHLNYNKEHNVRQDDSK